MPLLLLVAECEKRNPTDVCRQISDWLHDNTIMAWQYCLLDVLPVLTNVNVLFQPKLPIPHMLYDSITNAKSTLINMVGRGTNVNRTKLVPERSVQHDTPFNAYANKFILENSEGRLKSHGTSLLRDEVKALKQNWYKCQKVSQGYT